MAGGRQAALCGVGAVMVVEVQPLARKAARVGHDPFDGDTVGGEPMRDIVDARTARRARQALGGSRDDAKG